MTHHTSDNPEVSVVIATHNYGRYIARAVESVLAQTFQDFELIIIDDGSVDKTETIVEPFLADSRIKYIRTEHLGQPFAKNAGIRAASGRYIAFLDADDLWLPTKLEKQVRVFQCDSDERVAVVFTPRRWIDAEGREVIRDQRRPQRGQVLAAMFHRPFVCFSSAMVRRQVLDEVGYFDESIQYSVDYDLWLRVASRYEFDFVDEPLTLYRTGHANMSSRLHERVWCVQKIIERFLSEHADLVEPALARLVRAELYCDIASAAGQHRASFRMAWYARSLRQRACHAPAWRGLLVDWWLPPLIRLACSPLRRFTLSRSTPSRTTPSRLCLDAVKPSPISLPHA